MPVHTMSTLSRCNDDVLKTGEVADRIGVHPETLRNWRDHDPPKGPPFYLLPTGHARYPESELEDWIEQELETSEGGQR